MVTLELSGIQRQGLAAAGAPVLRLTFMQPLLHLSSLDPLQICSDVHLIIGQVAFRQFLEPSTGAMHVLGTLMTEVKTLLPQALNNLTVVSPRVIRKHHAAFAFDFLGRTFERGCHALEVFPVVSLRPVDGTCPTVQPTSADKIPVNQGTSPP